MGIKRPQENWTKFPNCILDNLDKFTPVEFQVLGLMVRKNLGFDDPNKRFSVSYICGKLGTKSNKKIISAINSLIEKGSIVEVGKAARGARLFEINWDAPEPVSNRHQNRCQIDTSTGVKSTPVPVSNRHQYRCQIDTSTGVESTHSKRTTEKERQKKNDNDEKRETEPSNQNVVVVASLLKEIPIPSQYKPYQKSIEMTLLNKIKKGIDIDQIKRNLRYSFRPDKEPDKGGASKIIGYLGMAIDKDYGDAYCAPEVEREPEQKIDLKPGDSIRWTDGQVYKIHRDGQCLFVGPEKQYCVPIGDIHKGLRLGKAQLLTDI